MFDLMIYALFNLYLGAVVFIIGSILLILKIKKLLKTKIVQIVLIAITQFVFSNLTSLAIWRFWILGIDIMFLFISLPALIAECITIPITLFVLKQVNSPNI